MRMTLNLVVLLLGITFGFIYGLSGGTQIVKFIQPWLGHPSEQTIVWLIVMFTGLGVLIGLGAAVFVIRSMRKPSPRPLPTQSPATSDN
jgi:hypothetical protein